MGDYIHEPGEDGELVAVSPRGPRLVAADLWEARGADPALSAVPCRALRAEQAPGGASRSVSLSSARGRSAGDDVRVRSRGARPNLLRRS